MNFDTFLAMSKLGCFFAYMIYLSRKYRTEIPYCEKCNNVFRVGRTYYVRPCKEH